MLKHETLMVCQRSNMKVKPREHSATAVAWNHLKGVPVKQHEEKQQLATDVPLK